MSFIKDIEISTPVVLGPMAGVTTLAYRDFMKPFGVGLSFSEMISDCGLFYGNKMTMNYYKTSKIDHPVGLQLFGFDKNNSLKAVEILENNAEYDILDLNFGCPVQKVTKTGAGSAWLKRPMDEFYDYVHSIVLASHKPVSAKIRLGWNEKMINYREVSKMLEDAGISLLSIHARTTAQLYSGKADYEILRGFGREISIPLCISGDIFEAEEAMKAKEITGASYIMVARGGLGNPRLVSNIVHLDRGEPLEPEPTLLDQVTWAEEFSNMLIDYVGERTAVMQLRGLIPHFFSGFPGYKKIRAEISMEIKTVEDLRKIFAGIRNRQKL
ncbi:MAG: tRNA-dihydrouridine synthase family protein [Bacilli bacterium]|nr:tRNA-dihydrouridine synthase family protein [Bacilli bacterium]